MFIFTTNFASLVNNWSIVFLVYVEGALKTLTKISPQISNSSRNGSVFHYILKQNHHGQWNCVTWLDNLNAKWIGLWSKQKASIVLDMHCSHGPFDQIWPSCEPYIVVLCWNWSFILFTSINWNKCIVFEVCFGGHQH